MTGLFASKSTERELVQVVRDFLQRLKTRDYDYIWNVLVTPKAAKLLSTALLPVNAYKENNLDEVLQPISDSAVGIDISFDEAFAVGFQKDMQDVRSQFFTGMALAIDSFGWHQATFEDCWVYTDDSAALLIEPSTPLPLVLPFIRHREEYQVDFEALVLFGMSISASSLYHIGQRALELGLDKSAIAYFELAASFSPAYTRITRLMLDNPLVALIVKDEREDDLLVEGEYILRARNQVLRLLSSPEPASTPVNMTQFLADTFKGYTQIPDVDLEQDEIEQLYSLGDGDLRKALAGILNGVNPVVAQREADKPHGSHEISDMELVVQHDGDAYRMSIPLKSGMEIRTRTVPVSIAYQIIRPFLYFPDSIVIFVTAKPCSQHLHNYIKLANDVLGLCIEVIENEELAKLLKINDLLPQASKGSG
jgi:hypothetical protein